MEASPTAILHHVAFGTALAGALGTRVFCVKVGVAKIAEGTATRTKGGTGQIVVRFPRENIVTLCVVPAQSFLNPPEVAPGKVASGLIGSCVNHNRDYDFGVSTWIQDVRGG